MAMESKSVFASRVFWLNLLSLVVALIAAALGHDWVASNPQVVSVLVAVQSSINLVLRFLTVGPVHVPGFDHVSRDKK